MLEGREVDLEHLFVELAVEDKLHVFEVEVGVGVLDVAPLKRPSKPVNQESDFVLVICREIHIVADVSGQEVLSRRLKCVKRFLFESDRHAWVHSVLVDRLNGVDYCLREKERCKNSADDSFTFAPKPQNPSRLVLFIYHLKICPCLPLIAFALASGPAGLVLRKNGSRSSSGMTALIS